MAGLASQAGSSSAVGSRCRPRLSGMSAASDQRLTAGPGSAAGAGVRIPGASALPGLALIPWGRTLKRQSMFLARAVPLPQHSHQVRCAVPVHQCCPARRGLSSPAGLTGKPRMTFQGGKHYPGLQAKKPEPLRPRGRAEATARVSAVGGQGLGQVWVKAGALLADISSWTTCLCVT